MYMGKKLWTDAGVLTAGSLLLRCAGLLFQVLLAERLGAEGLGLFQLIISVQALAVTLATSGMRYVVTRLVSEELGQNRPGGAVAVLRRCFLLSFILSVLSSGLLWIMAKPASLTLICDARAVSSLRVLALGLPFLSLTSVIGGYFTAVRKTSRSALVQIIEQGSMIAFTLAMLPTARATCEVERSCALICLAAVLADVVAFLLASVMYLIDRRRLGYRRRLPRGVWRRISALGAPIAVTAWARTALSTLKHLLIPAALRSSGVTASKALEAYGVIQGMAFPVLTFPSALFYSLAEVLLPELTEAQVQGDTARVNATVTRTLRFCLVISVGVAGVFFAFGRAMGDALFKSAEAGTYIMVLSPFVILMYMDAVTDGMLKGLGEQLFSMAINLLDALISLILVRFVVPIFAIRGYLAIIFFSELFNFSLSLWRLTKRATIYLSLGDLLLPPICAAGAVCSASLLLRLLGLPLSSSPISVISHIVLSLATYAAMMLLVSRCREHAKAQVC